MPSKKSRFISKEKKKGKSQFRVKARLENLEGNKQKTKDLPNVILFHNLEFDTSNMVREHPIEEDPEVEENKAVFCWVVKKEDRELFLKLHGEEGKWVELPLEEVQMVKVANFEVSDLYVRGYSDVQPKIKDIELEDLEEYANQKKSFGFRHPSGSKYYLDNEYEVMVFMD